MTVLVTPTYASIECVRDLCEPWIELWSGDEWGEVMSSLLGACQTDYGISDEDCALFTSKLFENLQAQKEWMDTEGRSYGLTSDEAEAEVQKRCRESREYWRKGGNLTNWEPAVKAANATIDSLPGWLFGDEG